MSCSSLVAVVSGESHRQKVEVTSKARTHSSKYEVMFTLTTQINGWTEKLDVAYDCHCPPNVNTIPPFIVFHVIVQPG